MAAPRGVLAGQLPSRLVPLSRCAEERPQLLSGGVWGWWRGFGAPGLCCNVTHLAGTLQRLGLSSLSCSEMNASFVGGSGVAVWQELVVLRSNMALSMAEVKQHPGECTMCCKCSLFQEIC